MDTSLSSTYLVNNDAGNFAGEIVTLVKCQQTSTSWWAAREEENPWRKPTPTQTLPGDTSNVAIRTCATQTPTGDTSDVAINPELHRFYQVKLPI